MDLKLTQMIRKLLFPAILFLLLNSLVPAQNQSLFDFVSSYDSIHLFIESDFKKLLKKKDEYQPASFMIKSGDEIIFEANGEVRSRGNMRKRVCYMPPVKIRFTKEFLRSKDWEDYRSLKLVNACSFNKLANTYIELEHLLYQIYGLHTENGFRTKSIEMHYRDSEGKKKPVDFKGFIIEHEDQLAKRLGGEVYKSSYFKPEQVDRESYLTFCMFQYMIGNTDWKVLNKHNLEVILSRKNKKVYAIPYDFDYSGVVHTSYAVPYETLPIKTVTERLYLGPCQSDEEVVNMSALFLSKKDDVMALVNTNISEKKARERCIYYLNEFYDTLENQKMARAIFTNCIDY